MLTPEEAAKYDAIRRAVDQELPEILSRRRAHEELVEKLLQDLKAARESAGLSLADVRDKTGMDRSAIAKLENGHRANPTLDTLIRYATAVGKRLVVSLKD
jgi:DNA-binding phage protein